MHEKDIKKQYEENIEIITPFLLENVNEVLKNV